jgi:hypothetical protein
MSASSASVVPNHFPTPRIVIRCARMHSHVVRRSARSSYRAELARVSRAFSVLRSAHGSERIACDVRVLKRARPHRKAL